MEAALKEITELFAKNDLHVKFESTDKFIELIQKTLYSEDVIASHNINYKYVPSGLYRPIKLNLYIIVLGYLSNEHSMGIRMNCMIKIINSQWYDFSISFGNLFYACCDIENFSAQFELIYDKDLCIQHIYYDTTNYLTNIHAVIEFVNRDPKHLLDNTRADYSQICDFFLATFMQHYKIRHGYVKYTELFDLLMKTRPLELIESEAKLYASLVDVK
jgi:hypothetical protein